MLLWRALTGDAMLLISHFRDEDLLCWDAGQRILDVLAQAHKHISEFEDQDDFDNAFYKLHQEQFAQWQLLSPSTVSASSISTAARGGVDNGSLASAPRGRRIHWGLVEYGHGNGSDWCVTAQSNTTSESET